MISYITRLIFWSTAAVAFIDLPIISIPAGLILFSIEPLLILAGLLVLVDAPMGLITVVVVIPIIYKQIRKDIQAVEG